jgi:hypothetical protein
MMDLLQRFSFFNKPSVENLDQNTLQFLYEGSSADSDNALQGCQNPCRTRFLPPLSYLKRLYPCGGGYGSECLGMAEYSSLMVFC